MKYSLILLSLFLISNSFAQGNFKSNIKAHRVNYKQDFTKHESSPFFAHPEAMKDINFYPPKKKYKVQAKIEKIEAKETIQIKTYAGTEKTFSKYAWAHFTIKGKPYKLMLYQNLRNLAIPAYKDLLFLPFKDATNDEGTYGGGRYIDLDLKEIKNGFVEIDFNKCYNPYCAFSDGYFCPVPPIENHLYIEIPVGEKMYTGPKLHRPE